MKSHRSTVVALGILAVLALGASWRPQPVGAAATTFPTVVAHRDFLNQAGNIGSTSLLTVVAGATYRVSVYTSEIPSGTAQVTPNVAWTDEFVSTSANGHQVFASSPVGDTFVLHAASGAILFSTNSTDSLSTYNVRTVVERLN